MAEMKDFLVNDWSVGGDFDAGECVGVCVQSEKRVKRFRNSSELILHVSGKLVEHRRKCDLVHQRRTHTHTHRTEKVLKSEREAKS